MADVIISYVKTQRDLTRALALKIELAGFSVWWDTDLLPYQKFQKEIDRQLDACKAAIIVWTPESVDSDWVRAEADHARRQRKLINSHDPELSPEFIPKPFNQTHSVRVTDSAAIIAAVRGLVGKPGESEGPVKTRPRRTRLLLSGFGVLITGLVLDFSPAMYSPL